MKARNLYLLIARDVTTDHADNMSSIVKIIEKFHSAINKTEMDNQRAKLPKGQFLALPIPFTMTSSWLFDKKLEKDTFLTIKINIMSPDGENLGGPEQEHVVPAGIDRVNLNFNSDGIPIIDAGKYTLHAQLLSKAGSLIAEAEYPYEVELIKS